MLPLAKSSAGAAILNPVAEPKELVREEPISPPPTSSTMFRANDGCLERAVAAVACDCSLR